MQTHTKQIKSKMLLRWAEQSKFNELQCTSLQASSLQCRSTHMWTCGAGTGCKTQPTEGDAPPHLTLAPSKHLIHLPFVKAFSVPPPYFDPSIPPQQPKFWTHH